MRTFSYFLHPWTSMTVLLLCRCHFFHWCYLLIIMNFADGRKSALFMSILLHFFSANLLKNIISAYFMKCKSFHLGINQNLWCSKINRSVTVRTKYFKEYGCLDKSGTTAQLFFVWPLTLIGVQIKKGIMMKSKIIGVAEPEKSSRLGINRVSRFVCCSVLGTGFCFEFSRICGMMHILVNIMCVIRVFQ